MFKPIKWLILKTRFNPENRPHININLGSVLLDENVIKPDFQILEKYQNFSSEILRLSLIGIGAYAVLFEWTFARKPEDTKALAQLFQSNPLNKYLVIASITFFAAAAASSLVHRYYSSDFMAYHIRFLRIKKYLEQNYEEQSFIVAAEEKQDRDVILQLCEFMIACSSIFLGLGVICIATALILTFFGPAAV